MVDIIRVGLAPRFVPYSEGWELQRRIHREVVDGRSPDTLLLLEHEPVFTAGTRTVESERPVDGTPVIDVDRGGKITWHGPGQLIGYPILRLPQPLDGVAYVRRLEGVLTGVLSPFGIAGRSIRGRTGVWVDTVSGPAKVAAIGVRVAEGVSMHGFALNCSNSLEPYRRIVPCGIRDAGVTSVSELLGRTVTPAEVVEQVATAFAAELEAAA
ncbi:lipoyl(octanoyl) transferase LipB [Salinibacterium sp. SYSU T00001]|uniref:lipoyl(octanoyl) transferase LipB n=1 Tax=Homoserinimonas sedimenticola TaxID=2986805 RepID=UPI0022356830|nr:lipoyl(octanoyl) transferase LipB [Salinibacterium sedimenticola]MCW4384868.1 lipoyl(octanoyl) transferase LipB [Salinibacterium sedimenticola]